MHNVLGPGFVGDFITSKGGVGLAWQDELRQLDEELAAGRISAAEYRTRRDQVVSAAADPGNAGAGQSDGASRGESTELMKPVSPPPNRPVSSAEATQVVAGVGQDGSAERTQLVKPNWPSMQPGASGDAERTQVVGAHQRPQPTPPPGFPQPGQNNADWQQQDEALRPPWAGSDFPPLVPQASETWLKQGPEVFADGRSRTGRIVAIVLAVVVLAGIGFGAYWLFGRGTSAAAPPAQTPSAPTTSAPPDPLAIGKIPGMSTGKSVQNFADVIALNYLNPVEQAAYQAAAPTKAELTVNALSGAQTNDAIVLTVQTGGAAAAKTAVAALVQAQITNHAQQITGEPTGVSVTQVGNTVRAHYYTAKGVIVRIEVTETDPTSALKEFNIVLNAQLTALPANG